MKNGYNGLEIKFTDPEGRERRHVLHNYDYHMKNCVDCGEPRYKCKLKTLLDNLEAKQTGSEKREDVRDQLDL